MVRKNTSAARHARLLPSAGIVASSQVREMPSPMPLSIVTVSYSATLCITETTS
ncbi:MAG: hypothetical protein ACLR4R_06230 [Oscillospiraceae bacterium]